MSRHLYIHAPGVLYLVITCDSFIRQAVRKAGSRAIAVATLGGCHVSNISHAVKKPVIGSKEERH